MKTGVKNAIFGLKKGQDFKNCVVHPHQESRGDMPPLPSGKTDALDMHKAKGYHQSFNFFDKSLIL